MSGTGLYQPLSIQHFTDELPEGFSRLDKVLEEYASKDGMGERLAKARQRIANRRSQTQKLTVATLRMAAGLSQAQLATAVQTSQPAISEYESGRREPLFSMAVSIAKALGVSADQLAEAMAK